MEQIINISISLDDLKILIKDLIGEYMLDYTQKNNHPKSDLLSYAQVFEKLYIKPERLKEWKEKGLINEYPVGNTVKFKISELFYTAQKLLKEMDEKKEEVPIE